jgi:hypothetical protein
MAKQPDWDKVREVIIDLLSRLSSWNSFTIADMLDRWPLEGPEVDRRTLARVLYDGAGWYWTRKGEGTRKSPFRFQVNQDGLSWLESRHATQEP